jgi:hypothetical protein
VTMAGVTMAGMTKKRSPKLVLRRDRNEKLEWR